MRILLIFSLLIPCVLLSQTRSSLTGITTFNTTDYTVLPRGTSGLSVTNVPGGSVRYATDTESLLLLKGGAWRDLITSQSNFTAGTLLFAGSSTTVDDATQLYYDPLGFLGIGSVPFYPLDIGSFSTAIRLPFGTTAQRPVPDEGLLRYNGETMLLEHGDGSDFKFIPSYTAYPEQNMVMVFKGGVWQADYIEESINLACSDETTVLAAKVGAAGWRMPFSGNIIFMKASVNTAPTGAPLIIDIKKNGVSIFTTRLQIDAGATTSVGSVVNPILTGAGSVFNYDDPYTIDIFSTGTAATGLKVYIYYVRS